MLKRHYYLVESLRFELEIQEGEQRQRKVCLKKKHIASLTCQQQHFTPSFLRIADRLLMQSKLLMST
jgi:hypothetical protein